MKIIFSGGGTLGPVTPLLHIYTVCKERYPDAECAWVGTKNGPERAVIEETGMPFFMIGAGKWRRYFSWANFGDVFRIIVAFFQSLMLIWHEKPDILISAGGFVSVPLHWAATFLGVRSWIHQQDVRPGLAIKLMAPCADKITTALEETTRRFSAKKTLWMGNPARDVTCSSLDDARAFFGFAPHDRVIFALGGGTGSATINQMVLEALPSLPKEWQIIHLVGKERPGDLSERAAKTFPNYHVYTFFTHEMNYAYALADVVVARAGFGTLTELATLKKCAIIVPMAGTHQEENARYFARLNALITLRGQMESGHRLAHELKRLMEDERERTAMGERLNAVLPRASQSMILEVLGTLLPE